MLACQVILYRPGGTPAEPEDAANGRLQGEAGGAADAAAVSAPADFDPASIYLGAASPAPPPHAQQAAEQECSTWGAAVQAEPHVIVGGPAQTEAALAAAALTRHAPGECSGLAGTPAMLVEGMQNAGYFVDVGSRHVLSGPTALEAQLAAAAPALAAAPWQQQPYAGPSAVSPFPSELPKPSAPLFSGGVPAAPGAALTFPALQLQQQQQHQQQQQAPGNAMLQVLQGALRYGQQHSAATAAHVGQAQSGARPLPSPPPPAGLPITSGVLTGSADPNHTGGLASMPHVLDLGPLPVSFLQTGARCHVVELSSLSLHEQLTLLMVLL